MSKDEQQARFNAVEKAVSGLQDAHRNQHEEIYQLTGLLGKLNSDLQLEQANMKRLQLEMEQVYSYLNKKK